MRNFLYPCCSTKSLFPTKHNCNRSITVGLKALENAIPTTENRSTETKQTNDKALLSKIQFYEPEHGFWKNLMHLCTFLWIDQWYYVLMQSVNCIAVANVVSTVSTETWVERHTNILKLTVEEEADLTNTWPKKKFSYPIKKHTGFLNWSASCIFVFLACPWKRRETDRMTEGWRWRSPPTPSARHEHLPMSWSLTTVAMRQKTVVVIVNCTPLISSQNPRFCEVVV